MEKRWDTVIPGDLKRLFVSGTHVPLVTKGLNCKNDCECEVKNRGFFLQHLEI